MGSKPAPTESCSLRQGTPSPGYLRDNVSITSDIYIYTAPTLSLPIKEADPIKVSQGHEEKGFTSFTLPP